MILEALKTKTAASHANVEASPLMAPIGSRSLTLTNYINILQKFYGFFHPLEGYIDNVPDIKTILPDLTSRRRSSSILQDLQLITGTPINPDTILICPNLPEIKAASAGVGALYVMEGSTLGGKFIARIINEILGFTPENGTAFFSGYGAQTGPKWKAFQEALVQYAASTHLEDAVVAAADETFRKLETWFTN